MPYDPYHREETPEEKLERLLQERTETLAEKQRREEEEMGY